MPVNEVLQVGATILVSVGGAGAIVLGLSNWLGKVWADRMMTRERAKFERELAELSVGLQKAYAEEIEHLRSKLLRATHVHRVQFEKEFEAYRDIWGHLVEVRIAVLSLRPVLDHVDPSEPEAERQVRRLKAFGEAFDPFSQAMEKNRPFYDHLVWTELRSLLSMFHGEAVDYQYKERKHSEYWREATKNREAISEQIDRVCEAIRERILGMTVVEDA